MAEVIQFSCPACDVRLRLPLAMAGARGPCPSCGQEIIAPDPERGLDAREPAPTPPPAAPAPSPPPEIPEPKPLPKRETATVQPPPQPRSPRWILFAFSILLTAVASLAAGYLIGVRSRPPITASPPAEVIPVIPPEAPLPPIVEPEPEPIVEPEPEPPPEEKPAPVKASAAAEATLKAFLDAPDWSTRAAYVLSPVSVRAAMEAYSHKVPDGPTPYQSISIQNSHTDKITGNTLFIYQVITAAHPTGIPVAVAETDSGWLVDWQTFVEFRDDLFESFANGPVDQTGRFHLIVSQPPAPRAANTENAHFSSFLLDPPFPGKQQIAYVKKASVIHATIVAATSNGAIFTPLLEVAKRKTPDGKTYLEITAIIAHDWLPEER